MTRCRRFASGLCVLVAGLASAVPLAAQQPPPQSGVPSPAQTNPLSTTTAPNPTPDPNRSAAPAPEQAVTPPPAGQAAPGAGSTTPATDPTRPPLVAKPAEPGDVDEVTLPAKPAAILAGKAKWEDAVPSLQKAFAQIEADLGKAGIKPAGRPLAVFTKTEDDGFEFDAMIPVAAPPAVAPASDDGLHFGTTPAGKALRFAHRGSYESIDGTYETLTAYLDAKDVVVQDRFVEEYVTDLKDGTDDALDVNIYALLK
ncbi:GyrI-like domain-containing protein [Methylobacterium persicinum]|uniref:Effector-binding domain-containing protein n=1 Tax=Methylobacterium persicinum TaxID=374426 RepID=A0ABU0HIR4_9HYPH|nr:GyrI-like domain-containing protein [Methylobacterium persicinum]MDQ0441610.1 effector-binding domain-containing protein [Methylobacterium persicinum]GJE39372.1 hypothetical protein KHHGKMAE_3454 [Methylobacterium persicinum]